MRNSELFYGFSAVASVLDAYHVLLRSSSDADRLRQGMQRILDCIYGENASLRQAEAITNGCESQAATPLGSCCLIPPDAESALSELARRMPALTDGRQLRLTAAADFSAPLTMVMAAKTDAALTGLEQEVLLRLLRERKKRKLRIVDLSGGNVFSGLSELFSALPDQAGGRILSTESEMSRLLRELEDYVHSSGADNGGYVTALALPSEALSKETGRRLLSLLSEAKKHDLSILLRMEPMDVRPFVDMADFAFGCVENGKLLLGCGLKLPFTPDPELLAQAGPASVSETITALQAARKVDTHYARYFGDTTEYLAMDSSEALRIPFAVDGDGVMQFFELGGEAPSHALLSGSTGSGKSVALHTLILQIVRNYHPDDVEIWAIDYKAVEFDGYISRHSPHFRVVGHDSSTEFSLSLLDLLHAEYERRQRLFLESGVKDLKGYRQKFGPRTLPRIVVFIDEFQIMTQAVQTFDGGKDYRTILENLLRLTRAMGISFVLCSQTIASGLSGLTDSARDQIGCRLCLRHDDESEIRETLKLSGEEASAAAARAKNLTRGQGIYKRIRWARELAADGKSYELKELNILYINDEERDHLIDEVNRLVGKEYTPKDEIFVRGGGRIPVTNKERHPLQRFLRGDFKADSDCLDWYPAAPASLEDCFHVQLENAEGSSILLVGESDDLRESVVVHSLCGFLMDPENTVICSFVDETYSDRERMIGHLRKIRSERLILNVGLDATLSALTELRKLKPLSGHRRIYLWYGLDKLKNELFLRQQDAEDEGDMENGAPQTKKPENLESMIDDLMSFMDGMNLETNVPTKPAPTAPTLSIEECRHILSRLFEEGPENDYYSFLVFNNNKALRRSKMVDLSAFEHRIGTRMSGEDSYELFGSSLAINKTDDNTVIYYRGSGQPTALRPYLLPSEAWYSSFNNALKERN